MTRKTMKLFSPKQPTRIACWNVRTMYQSGKSAQIAKEMDRYNIEILILINPNKDDPHEKGVGFLLNKT